MTSVQGGLTAEEKAEDLRRRALDCARLEEKLIFLRSAVQYSPNDCALLASLAEQLVARAQEFLREKDNPQALSHLEEAERHLLHRNALVAQKDQAVQLHGVYSEQYLRMLLAKLDCVGESILEKAKNDGRVVGYHELLRRVKRHIPEIDANSAKDPLELQHLREGIYDRLLSLSKAMVVASEWEPKAGTYLYSLLENSGYFARLYQAEGGVPEMDFEPGSRPLQGCKVRVYGAGVCGLVLTYCLKLRGAEVIGVLDKRGMELSDLTLRGQNVSWTGFEQHLRPILGDAPFNSLMKKLYAAGAKMDRSLGKLRSTIGAFQEVFIQELQAMGVDISMGLECGVADLLTDRKTDLQFVATGIHALEHFPCELKPVFFSERVAKLRTQLTMFPSDKELGYSKTDRDQGAEGGMGWRSINETVGTPDVFMNELERLALNLHKLDAPEYAIDKVMSLSSSEKIAHRFSFGNDNDSFETGLEDHGYPSLSACVTVLPWLLTHTVSHVNPDVPTLFIGDAGSSTHPLAAIGNSLSFQNVASAVRFTECRHALKQLARIEKNAHVQKLISGLHQNFQELFEREGRKMALMVFLQSCLCSLYSKFEKKD